MRPRDCWGLHIDSFVPNELSDTSWSSCHFLWSGTWFELLLIISPKKYKLVEQFNSTEPVLFQTSLIVFKAAQTAFTATTHKHDLHHWVHESKLCVNCLRDSEINSCGEGLFQT